MASQTKRPGLVLGTAQLVRPYGVVRRHVGESPLDPVHALDLLAEAQRLSMFALDTAPVYGSAEAVIGASDWSGPVWTKLNPRVSLRESIEASLRALQRSNVEVLFVHSIDHLLGMSSVELADLEAMRDSAYGKLGLSVYDPEEVLIAANFVRIDIVQAPVNVFDSRFATAMREGRLPDDVALVARSVLLQGALAQPELAARKFQGVMAAALLRWGDACAAMHVAPARAALTWVASLPWLSAVIVGAEAPAQLRELVSWGNSDEAYEMLTQIPTMDIWPHSDPRRWA